MIYLCISERKLLVSLIFTDISNYQWLHYFWFKTFSCYKTSREQKDMVLGLFCALLDSRISENPQKRINCSSTWAPIFTFISRAKKTKTGKTQQQQTTTTKPHLLWVLVCKWTPKHPTLLLRVSYYNKNVCLLKT